jgi:hypothetical protein
MERPMATGAFLIDGPCIEEAGIGTGGPLVGIVPGHRGILFPIRVFDANDPIRRRGKLRPSLHHRTEKPIPALIPSGDIIRSCGVMEGDVTAIAAGQFGCKGPMAAGTGVCSHVVTGCN